MLHFRTNLQQLAFPSVSGAIAIAALLYRAHLEPSWRFQRIESLEYLFILCSTFSIVGFYNAFPAAFRLLQLRTRGLTVAFAVMLFVSVYKLGMYQLGGFDEVYVINAAYHYLQGLKPITDYPSPMPPLFMAGIRSAVLLFGFRWASLSLFTAGFAALTFTWLYCLLRNLQNPHFGAFLIAVVVELSTMLVVPFWWYNNTTSLAVVLLLVSVVACLKRRDSVFSWISLSISLGMLLCSKPNTALMCFSPCVLLFTKHMSQLLRTIAAIGGAIIISLATCRMAEIPVAGLFRSYLEVAKLRGSPLQMVGFRQPYMVENVVQACIALFVLLCFIDAFAKAIKRRRPLNLLLTCSFAGLTCIEMLCTNAELKIVDLVVMLVALALLMQTLERAANTDRERQTLVALFSLFLVWSSFFGIIHLRILKIREGAFYEPLPTKEIESGFLGGLSASPRLLAVQQQVGDTLVRFPAKKVFFGPRMEFEYAVFHKSLIPRLPVQWDAGNQYAPVREPEMLVAFRDEDPDLLIFLKDDYVHFRTVADYIKHSPLYEIHDEYSDLTVYVRKTPPIE